MYQVPLTNVDKIRKARKSVKRVLSDIGLEDCQEFLKDLDKDNEKDDEKDLEKDLEKDADEKDENDEKDEPEDFEWFDFTEGFNGRMQKKWPYRSRSLCCAMCKYSSPNIYNFRSHVSRCHSFMQSVCALSMCTQCTFIGHPKVLRKHTLFFHGQTETNQQPTKESAVVHRTNERYQCQKCGYPTSLIFALKKHIILKHLGKLAETYIGYRLQNQGGTTVKVYCCKVCKGNTGTLDQMLHHMLVAPTHYSVSTQVQAYIYENKNFTPKPAINGNTNVFAPFSSIAPKGQRLVTNSMAVPSNGQTTRTVLTLQGTPTSTTLFCTPGTNQAFLPPQASALVQLASAEAKGLLQPGTTITLQGPLAPGKPIQIPINPTTLPLLPAQPKPVQQSPVILTGVQATGAPTVATLAKPVVVSQSSPITPAPPTLQGTMLTSQSLLNHLIPTGNSVNGMPTYTFAPLQVMPVSAPQSTPTRLKPIEQSSNTPQVKKWVTCPHCNELFPSNVFDLHTEAVHKTKSKGPEYLAARAPFLKKMADKSIKCLTCKIVLSDKTIFQHLLHGLNCLSCSGVFFSVKQLSEHIKVHNPTSKVYSDFLRQNCRIQTKSPGVFLIQSYDVHTTGPKEVLGDSDVHLALLSSTNEHIYFKLKPSIQPESCAAPVKLNSTYCPFCNEKSPNETKHLQHLKQKHFVAPTIHAILRTEAFKCIHCNGVYTGKVTQHAVMLHIQRCRCSPKQPQTAKTEAQPIVRAPQAAPKPLQQITTTAKQTGLYFLQVPQGVTLKQAISQGPLLAPAPPKPTSAAPETAEEVQSKKRIESALKAVIEANKREREERAAKRRKLEKEQKAQKLHQIVTPPPVPVVQPTVKLAIEPTLLELRSDEERRLFCNKYFNHNPYASRAESQELCKRLSLSKQELGSIFSKRRLKCMKTIKNNKAAVLLGFNMTELNKLKHNLDIPEQKPPPENTDQMEEVESDEEENVDKEQEETAMETE